MDKIMRWCLLGLLLAPACSAPTSSTKSNPPVEAPAAMVDLSGDWNDTDAQLVVDALVPDLLRAPWKAALGKREPVIELDSIRNRSSEHINVRHVDRLLVAALEKGGLKVGQPGEACPDLVLTGGISAMNDAVGDPERQGSELRSAQLGLALIDPVTLRIVWSGEHRVRKLVERQPGKGGKVEVKVTRLPTDKRVELSGSYSDLDAVAAGTSLAADLLKSPALRSGDATVLRLDHISNRSAEQINFGFLLRLMEGALVRGGVTVVASESPRQVEKDRCEKNALAATHLLSGVLVTRSSATARQEKRRYDLMLELTKAADSAKVWSQFKSVTKVITRAAAGDQR
jgi:hypothetical protein